MTSITILGKPKAKARPRAAKRGGHAVVYNPKSNETAEAGVKALAGPHFHKPFQGAVAINAYFRPAKSWSKKKRAAAIGGPHIQKPDFDNVGKLYCDALNGIAYNDDAQIASGLVNKWWSETERVEIEVTPFSAIMCRSPEVAELPVHGAINGDDNARPFLSYGALHSFGLRRSASLCFRTSFQLDNSSNNAFDLSLSKCTNYFNRLVSFYVVGVFAGSPPVHLTKSIYLENSEPLIRYAGM